MPESAEEKEFFDNATKFSETMGNAAHIFGMQLEDMTTKKQFSAEGFSKMFSIAEAAYSNANKLQDGIQKLGGYIESLQQSNASKDVIDKYEALNNEMKFNQGRLLEQSERVLNVATKFVHESKTSDLESNLNKIPGSHREEIRKNVYKLTEQALKGQPKKPEPSTPRQTAGQPQSSGKRLSDAQVNARYSEALRKLSPEAKNEIQKKRVEASQEKQKMLGRPAKDQTTSPRPASPSPLRKR